MTVNEAMGLLIEDLAAGVPEPLSERLMVPTIWADLARIAGEAVPAPVRRLIDGDADEPPAAA